MLDLLIRGGTVVDGTGAPRFEADVLLRDGKIAAVGRNLGSADREVDAGGLVVAPGFIDPHTHYDAQLFWDPRGTSSCWHGVTTVMMGHCGYSLAPMRPESRDYLIRMLGRVEEMPLDVLEKHLPWSWTSMGQYIDALDRGLGLNAVPMVGHSTLRTYVMGPAALEREATEDEVAQMRAELKRSLDDGAFGLTTSRSPSHNDGDWRPVPSRQASKAELVDLASELRGRATGTLGLIAAGVMQGLTDEDKDVILAMCHASGKPLQLQGDWRFCEEARTQGATVWGFSPSISSYRIWSLREGTNTFHSMPTWREIMDLPEDQRLARLMDASLRPALRAEVEAEASGTALRPRPQIHWRLMLVERAARPENRDLQGTNIEELAKRQGKHVVDALLDLAASEDFHTDFRTQFSDPQLAFSEERAERLRSDHVAPFGSDAGAHIGSECLAGEGSLFLKHWVLERGLMSLEQGVQKLTCNNARFIGLTDRGAIRPGMAADIMIFDPGRIDALSKERSRDLPGGGLRWVQRGLGVEYVFVNGEASIWQGTETGRLGGRVLRSAA